MAYLLVLMADSLPEAEMLKLRRQIKAGWPETGCLVLGVGSLASRLGAVLQRK